MNKSLAIIDKKRRNQVRNSNARQQCEIEDIIKYVRRKRFGGTITFPEQTIALHKNSKGLNANREKEF